MGAQIPIPEQFSFELQFQLGLQGNSGNRNPFAYAHALQFRPWVHYDGIAHLTITAAMSYIYYFTVPGTSYYRHPQWRFTTFGALKQQLKGGSLYEQLRFELLNFRASNGDVQHLPRLRIRFGQNLYLSEQPSKPYLGVYEEAIVQLPRPSYSNVHFKGARFFAGYGFDCGRNETDGAARVPGRGRCFEQRIDRHLILWTGVQHRVPLYAPSDERKTPKDNGIQGLLRIRISNESR